MGDTSEDSQNLDQSVSSQEEPIAAEPMETHTDSDNNEEDSPVDSGQNSGAAAESSQSEPPTKKHRNAATATTTTAAAATAGPPPVDRPDSAAQLNELEATLRQPDAVMEPNILASLRDYVKANGHPKHAVEFLSENYVGYAQMANLACGWLKLLDSNSGNEVADTTPNQPASKIAGSVPPSHSVAQPQQPAGGGGGDVATAAASAVDKSNRTEEELETHHRQQHGRTVPYSAMDEAYFLRQLVLAKFDPQKFSGIFSAGGSGAPKWLSGLISDRDGRELIYTLSAKYQNSLLLNFAMQKILMQPGRDIEAASVGASLVGYFGVYHRLLAVRLKQAAAARDEATLQQLSKELCQAAVESQHAYVHAQQLLRELALDVATQPWAPRFLRMAQEMEAAVPGPAPWKMHRWYEPDAALQFNNGNNIITAEGRKGEKDINNRESDGFGGDGSGGDKKVVPSKESADDVSNGLEDASTAAWLVSDILANTSSGAPATTSDVIRLYRLYCPRGEEKKDSKIEKEKEEKEGKEGEQQEKRRRPKVALLRQPRLIEVLLQAVFSPGKQLQTEAQAAFIGVLSLAVAGLDTDSENTTDNDTAIENIKNKEFASIGSSPLEQPAVVSAQKALEAAAELAHKALNDEILTAEERERGDIAMQEPCCAAGLLAMLLSRLTSHEYWAAAYHIHKEPPFLPLFLAIVRQQPSMHSTILSLISSALGVMGAAPSGPDVARALLQVAVALVAAGRVEQVLEWAERWARNADAGLVRVFFFGVLEIASPPYSRDFAVSMVRLGAIGGALRQKMGSKAWMARGALLAEFAAAAEESLKSGGGPLGREETSYLRELNLSLKNSGFSVK